VLPPTLRRARRRPEEAARPEPFIFIAAHTVKEGKLQVVRKYVQEHVEVARHHEPRLLAFNLSVNEAGTELTNIQVHPEADSRVFHMQVLRERIGKSSEFIQTDHIEFLGTPNPQILELARQLAGSGVPLSVKPRHLGVHRLPEA
jgi:hypothetical protein